ncbi:MAG: DUF2070 family protein [Candidatus Caldarchaeum sp.]
MANTSAGAIADRYRLIKGFHGGRGKAAAIILAMAVFFAAFTVLITRSMVLAFTAFTLALVITLPVNYVVEKTLNHRCQNYTARRLTALSIVEMIVLAAALPISYAVGVLHPTGAVAVIASFTTAAVFMGYSVRRAIGYKVNPLTAAVLSTQPMILGIIPLHVYLNSFLKALQTSATAYLVGLAFMEACRYVIDRIKSIQGVKPFTLLQAFLSSLLSGRSKDLEEMMERLGRSEEVRCELFVVRREGQQPLAIVVSEIHPGPFRNVGSSMFPSLVQQKLSAKGFESVVFKGLSSHEKNIANFETSESIAEQIASEALALSLSSRLKPFTFPVRHCLNGVSALTWGMAGRTITVLTLHPQPMEDLPPEIVADVSSDRVVVVDAHNSFSDGFEALEKDSVERIKTLLQTTMQQDVEDVNGVSVGFARIVPSKIGLAEGVGAGGISCIIFEAGGRKAAVVVADANNALPWVRDSVVEIGRRYGCVEAELCTTDTHMVNAVSLGGRGYHPLGEAIEPHTLTELIDEVYRKAVATLAPASATHKSVVIKDVKVFSDFLEAVAGSVSFGVKTYAVAGVLAFAASLLTVLAF